MPAPKKNKYYLLAEITGRPKKLTKDIIVKKSTEYFNWCESNPFKEQIAFNYQGRVTKSTLEKMRPFTLEGLCNHLGIVVNTWKVYEKRKDFMTVCAYVRQIIENQQFEGAASGFLNPSIIARKQGLTDSQNIKHQGDKEHPIHTQLTVMVKHTGKKIANSEDEVVI